MRKNNVYNILVLSSLYAWLLSFPMQGPVLEALGSLKNIEYSVYALTFTGFHALGLIISTFLIKIIKNNKLAMIIDAVLCLAGSILMLLLGSSFWGVIAALMAVASADYIIRWSYFYIRSTAVVGRMKFMAATIIVSNIYYAALSALRVVLKPQLLLFLVIIPLALSLFFLTKIDSTEKKDAQNDMGGFKPPVIFILMVSNLTFGIFINCGFMNMVIYPYFQDFYNIHLFYESIPYIAALLMMYYLGDRIKRTLPVYLAASLIVFAFAAFVFLNKNLYSYLLVETFMQTAYAFFNVFLWTLLGDAASVYGHTYQIFAYTLFANVVSIFAGGLIGHRFSMVGNMYKSITGIFSLVILFVVVSIVPWISKQINDNLEIKDILETEKKESLKKREDESKEEAENTYTNVRLSNLKNIELLTPRELEIVALLLSGYTNKQICSMLYISENTLKVHNRHIYSKLEIYNRKELLQKALRSHDVQY